MEIRKINAARGWIWVKQGWQLIMLNPLMSVGFALMCALLTAVAFKIPVLGPLLAVLLLPMLLAVYMRVCRALEEKEKIKLQHIFDGMQKYLPRLLALGAFALMALLVISMVMVFIGGEALTTLLEKFQSTQDAQLLMGAMMAAGSGVPLSFIVGFTLLFALMLALQYAPMLVLFSNEPPLSALRASLTGSMRNLIPYTVYSLIMQVAALALSILPQGIGLIILLPLSLTSLYVSYRNIFPFAGELTSA